MSRLDSIAEDDVVERGSHWCTLVGDLILDGERTILVQRGEGRVLQDGVAEVLRGVQSPTDLFTANNLLARHPVDGISSVIGIIGVDAVVVFNSTIKLADTLPENLCVVSSVVKPSVAAWRCDYVECRSHNGSACRVTESTAQLLAMFPRLTVTCLEDIDGTPVGGLTSGVHDRDLYEFALLHDLRPLLESEVVRLDFAARNLVPDSHSFDGFKSRWS